MPPSMADLATCRSWNLCRGKMCTIRYISILRPFSTLQNMIVSVQNSDTSFVANI